MQTNTAETPIVETAPKNDPLTEFYERVKNGEVTGENWGLTPKYLRAFQEMLRFSIEQGTFPQAHSIGKRLKGIGINDANLWHLARFKLVQKASEPGVWEFTHKSFELFGLPSSPPKTNIKTGWESLTGKRAEFWALLMEQKVGPSILFNADSAREVQERLHVIKSFPWDALRQFEKKGLCSIHRLGAGKGMTISFEPQTTPFAHKDEKAKHDLGKISVSKILKRIDGEILALEQELEQTVKKINADIDEKKRFRTSIEAYASQKGEE